MGKVRTILLNQSVLADNDGEAQRLREELKEKGTFLINVMSSPGAGKTTLLVGLINRLKEHISAGVMEADIDSDVDAVRVAEKTGCKSIQLHTGGMCHLDAQMTRQGLEGLDGLPRLIFLENVGNLVCPAEYDTGAHLDAVLLSVPCNNHQNGRGGLLPLRFAKVHTQYPPAQPARGHIACFRKDGRGYAGT